MKKRNCLVVDDQLRGIQGILEKTKRIALNNHIEIHFEELNPTDDRFYKKDTESGIYNVDETELRSFIENEYRKNFDLIVTDFAMTSDFTGIEFITLFRKINTNAKFIIYSGRPEQIAKHLFGNQEIDKVSINKIDSLLKANILRILDKNDSLDSVIIELLKKQSLDNIFENKLLETQADLVFKSIYPKFKDKKVSEIVRILQTDETQSEAFKNELVDQLVDYMIELNKDDEE